jgi:16S rRNA (uracil1498-N3)-methyltransferase
MGARSHASDAGTGLRPSGIRLFVDRPLAAGADVALDRAQAHYLRNVMRVQAGSALALFNPRDGEWRATLETVGKNEAVCRPVEQVRTPAPEPDLWLVFAPVKRGPVDLVAQKATELGVAALQPVFTRRTAVSRVNAERLRAIAVEAAEQCERLSVPEIRAPLPLDRLLAEWPLDRHILLCDETGAATGAAPPVAAALAAAATPAGAPWAVFVGPEGGYAPEELDAIRKLTIVTPASLGDRILRADTAAIAALACWQALLGDWGKQT